MVTGAATRAGRVPARNPRNWGETERAQRDTIFLARAIHITVRSSMADPVAPEQPVTFSRAESLVIGACAISMLIVQMDWFALNLAIPAIARQFDMASTDLQWVVSGYMISIGALMVTAGRLADIFGRRKIIVLGLIMFGVLSAVCGRAASGRQGSRTQGIRHRDGGFRA